MEDKKGSPRITSYNVCYTKLLREEHIGWDDPWLASLDLEYHNVNPERGLYLGLEAEGKAWRMTVEADVQAALSNGPSRITSYNVCYTKLLRL